jgi:hypothetical protein
MNALPAGTNHLAEFHVFSVGQDYRVLFDSHGSRRQTTCPWALEQDIHQPSIGDQYDEVAALGLSQGTERSLLAQLGAVGASLERGDTDAACGQLGAFINHANAQRGKQLSDEQAADLIALASEIRSELGC